MTTTPEVPHPGPRRAGPVTGRSHSGGALMEWYCWALCGLMAICFVALLAMCVAGGRADRARDEVERLRSAERAEGKTKP